jgi:hypothetical protein
MAKTIAELRAQSQASLNNLITEIEEANKPKYTPKEKDARFWAPTLDSTGRTEVIARFLPAVDGETFPYAKFWGYYFKGPNGWYIQNSRTSLGKGHKDPMAEYNAKIWKAAKTRLAHKSVEPITSQIS